MDADTLVVDNIDELFEREELSATPDIGWPDCFNSGVFVFTPSDQTFRGLLKLAESEGSFDGGDQVSHLMEELLVLTAKDPILRWDNFVNFEDMWLEFCIEAQKF